MYPFLEAIKDRLRNWRTRRNTLAELYQPTALETIARDLHLSKHELQAVSAQWPDASDLLNERMTALKLDPKQLSPTELGALRDAQRVCTLCGSKNPCKYDLTKDPNGSDWRKYCPNVSTLDQLQQSRWFASLPSKQQK